MTFDEMAARAQYEWQRAEDAEAEVRAITDMPATDAQVRGNTKVCALVEAVERVLSDEPDADLLAFLARLAENAKALRAALAAVKAAP